MGMEYNQDISLEDQVLHITCIWLLFWHMYQHYISPNNLTLLVLLLYTKTFKAYAHFVGKGRAVCSFVLGTLMGNTC